MDCFVGTADTNSYTQTHFNAHLYANANPYTHFDANAWWAYAHTYFHATRLANAGQHYLRERLSGTVASL